VSFNTKSKFTNNSVENEMKVYQVPIVLCGYHNTFSLPTESQIAQISKYSSLFPTVVYFNQGSEYGSQADGLQQLYAKKMIDAGADVIVGQGAHVVQNTEVYNNKLIVYSMGNFIYDQQTTPDVRQSAAINLSFDFPYNESINQLQTITPLCLTFKDNCYNLAVEKELTKPVFKLKYDAIATDNTGKVAKKADELVQIKIKNRLNWDKSIKLLN
jgi:hypothetical protein